jgi:HEPN domain-containing protein
MNKFSAGLFVNLGSSLQWFGTLPRIGEWNREMREDAIKFGEKIREDLRKIGCETAARFAGRFGWQSFKPSDVEPLATHLRQVIFDEMDQQLFFWVPKERARFYELPEDKSKWNDTEKAIDGIISDRFKKASVEILAARKAYAVGQFTPCVFHLMRAAETGLKALYKTLNISAPRLADSWGNLLKPLDEQLKKNVADRYGDWATNPDFFDHATNDVRAIKRAWRDTTMHIESNYNDGEALKALNAVTSFFEHLSSKLDQDGKFYP